MNLVNTKVKTSNMLIPTWTPGQHIRSGEYDDGGSGGQRNDSPDYVHLPRFLYIGLSIILVALIASCCCCCFWKKTPMARKRARVKTEAVAVEATNHSVQDGQSLPPRYSVDGERQPLPDYALATMAPAPK